MKHHRKIALSSLWIIGFLIIVLFLTNNSNKPVTITILHTNDVHSRIEPFPKNNRRFSNQGGFAKRASVINKIRNEKKNVLLFDSGDFFQGTPYFNFFDGELEIKLMSEMGYDAVTLGNHEFDNGIDRLAKQISKAEFSFISTNYDVKNTKLNDIVLPWKIFKIEHIKIGVIGLGINPDGLIASNNVEGMNYLDPFETGEETAKFLKTKHKCDFVIALSHIGLKMSTNIDDINLAKKSSNIDMILGGHTHIFLDEPLSILNANNKNVTVHQSGWGGSKIEQIDIEFFNK